MSELNFDQAQSNIKSVCLLQCSEEKNKNEEQMNRFISTQPVLAWNLAYIEQGFFVVKVCSNIFNF